MQEIEDSSNRLARVGALTLALSLTAPPGLGAQAPTFTEVVGHDFGERITLHHEMVGYLARLAESSDRVAITYQGETWELRRLPLAIVTAPENHARLDAIRETAGRLADPRSTTPTEAATLMETQPVIVWYGGSIHGFELSGSEGLLKLLERLATAEDEATLNVLRDAVVLIDPMLNPDGRDAFAYYNHQNIGRLPNPERDDWVNDFTSWQARKFRTGHYYFDTNRDWFAHTQRETRARLATFQTWRPQVVVDAHEMGPDAEFYFDPATDPWGPYYPEFAALWHVRFGQAYAAAFDSAGFEYMTRERYNYFYPGYTTSYGSYQGGIGMLYEQGSSRGLTLNRADRSVRTLRDALEQQYLAAWAAARLAAKNRGALLREYYEAHRAAVADGDRGARRYLIAPEGDPLHIAELVNLLIRNGIEVGTLADNVRLSDVRDRAGRAIGAHDFPAGTYVLEAAQPRNRLIRSLMEPDLPLPAEFLREARERVERDENPRFYDITAWSLPLMFNVGGYSSADGRSLRTEPVAREILVAGSTPTASPGYAYLIDGRQAAALAALYHLKARGYRAAVIREPTRLAGRDLSSGTVILRLGQNDPDLHEAVETLADRYGLRVDGVDTGLAEGEYPSLGSGDAVITVRTPVIGILAEDPIDAYSFGWAWYTLDRQYEIPVTVLRTGHLADTPLDRFNVLIIPSADADELATELSDGGMQRLDRWVRDGGTLVTLGAASELPRVKLELIGLRSWYESENREDAQRFEVPGAILRVELSSHRWLASGYADSTFPALVASDRIYLPPAGAPSSRRRVVGSYATSDLRLSGHAWPESLERLPGAVFLYEERVERGRVIAFAEDPNFRAFWRGANRLFLNAVILGPSAP